MTGPSSTARVWSDWLDGPVTTGRKQNNRRSASLMLNTGVSKYSSTSCRYILVFTQPGPVADITLTVPAYANCVI